MVEVETTQDLEALRTRAIHLDRSVRSLLRENAKLRLENLRLQGLDAEQVKLALTIDETPVAEAPEPVAEESRPSATPKPRSLTGRTPQPKLAHREVKAEIEPAATCPDCQKQIVAFDSWDTSETVTVTRCEYEVVVEQRQKGRCGCKDKVHTAPSTVLKMRPGGRYSVEVTADIAVNKWADHLPLERQARRMERLGLEVTPQTLFDQVAAMAEELRPAYDQLLAEMLASPVLGVDETSWKMLDTGGHGSEYRAAIGLSTPTAAAFIFDEGKSTELMDKHLAAFSGTLVCDGLKVYGALARTRKEQGQKSVVLANCWAHVFRRFRDAATDFPVAEKMLAMIGELYEIDRRAGPFPGDLEARRKRRKLREKESTKVLRRIRELAMKLVQMPKDLSISSAAAYLISYWAGLTEFVRNAEVPLDNNGAERDLRQLVQGRKNHYGSGSQRGLDTAAVLYTLIQTCIKLGVDPYTYLVEAVRRRRTNDEIHLPRHALTEPTTS
jgi:transposase